jgi:alpha-glucosidase
VLYQIYPRSFADSNGDGVGDLEGIIGHLDHLEWLGVDGVWLSPVTVSPNADWGYDVADYCDIDPDYGDLATLDRLVAEAGRRGIRVLLDLVPNHTSDRHPWFQDARRSRTADHRDFYVWADPAEDGGPPNNWVSSFGGPAWSFSEATGQYYLHNFTPEQPDLNWWHEPVREAFDDIFRFWFDRGVAGFRIDVCHMVVKDAALRDNPPAGPGDPFIEQMFGQHWLYNANRPEVHDVIRRWRRIADSYDPPRVLVGETSVENLEVLATYYGDGTDELHLAFNFVFLESPLEAAALRRIVEETRRLLPAGAWPVWCGSNHDVPRLATHWGGGEVARTKVALLMLLGIPGTVFLYQGDEIGLVDGPITQDTLRDPVGKRFWPHYAGRDPERTPMPWTGAPGGGFCPAGVSPWLPMADPADNNVADQRDDPDSVLSFVRRLLALRRANPDLVSERYEALDTPDGVWAWRRGETTTVACNLSDRAATVVLAAGDEPTFQLVCSTDPGRPAGPVAGGLLLGPWEGAVVVGR